MRGRDTKKSVTGPADAAAPIARAIRARARQLGGSIEATFAEDARRAAAPLDGPGWGALLEPDERLELAACGPRAGSA